ncbi:MAG: hypothetical protein GQ574_17740 [Crocinitomix sp.]|nr:hypothetical protein [Crocinitomix sp.]
MKVVLLSEFANHDFVDYVASFFENAKREVFALGYKPKGISFRKSGNLCNNDELKGIVKDAALIIIARNKNQHNENHSQNDSLLTFNDLTQNKVALYFDISECAVPSLKTELIANSAVLESNNELISPFFVPNYKETFSKAEGIVNTELYLQFIRKINAIKSNELATYFRTDRFTCGIDPTRKFFGEEDGY